MKLFGRLLQLAALMALPAGLAAGLVDKNVRLEMQILGVCLVLFYLGKALQGKQPDRLD